MSSVWLCNIVYVAGVAWGLLMSDGRPLERVVLALLWPLGPLAFIATMTILLGASLIAYPLVGVPMLLALGVLWWVFFLA